VTTGRSQQHGEGRSQSQRLPHKAPSKSRKRNICGQGATHQVLNSTVSSSEMVVCARARDCKREHTGQAARQRGISNQQSPRLRVRDGCCWPLNICGVRLQLAVAPSQLQRSQGGRGRGSSCQWSRTGSRGKGT
jgi:hypothetical protein